MTTTKAPVRKKEKMVVTCPACLDPIPQVEYNDHMLQHSLDLEVQKEWEDVFRPEAWEE